MTASQPGTPSGWRPRDAGIVLIQLVLVGVLIVVFWLLGSYRWMLILVFGVLYLGYAIWTFPLRLWTAVKTGYQYVEGHFVLVGVLLYAYVTLIGLLYSEYLYLKIGLSPFLFFEPSDFLLAGLRHPVALSVPIIVSIVNFIWMVLFFYVPVFGLVTTFFHEPSERLKHVLLRLNIAFSLLSALVVMIFMPFIAVQITIGEEIKPQCGEPVQIYLRKEAVGEKEAASPLSRTIIGSTQKMLLLKDTDKQAYGAMPIDVMLRIVPNGPPLSLGLWFVCAVFK